MQASARSTLLSLVEDHATNLVREATLVKRHSKRARLHQTSTSKDDERGVIRHRLHAEDINLALQWRGTEKLYATGTVVPAHDPSEDPSSRHTNLVEYLKSEMNLRPPSEVGLTAHWLAVDGIQPEIPQNPSKASPHMLHSMHDLLPFANTEDGVSIRQLLPLLLSEELQLYFTRVTLAIQRGGATPITRQQQDSALASVDRDPGLQELVPFFTKYAVQEIYKYVKIGNPEHCRTLVRLVHAMLRNPRLHLELHLQLLFPALVTCIVARRLSSLPTDNHWALRREAAHTVFRACTLFGDKYATLAPRVLHKLCDATGANRPFTTKYGGIVAISYFGAKAIDAFLLPLVSLYWNNWEKALKNEFDLEKRIEIQMCQQAVLNALGIFLRRVRHSEQTLRIPLEELEDTFGDVLMSLQDDQTDYSCCFI